MTQARQQLLYFSFSVSWDKKTLLWSQTQDPSSQRTVVLDAFKSKTCRHLCKLWTTVPLGPNASSLMPLMFRLIRQKMTHTSLTTHHWGVPTSFQTMTPPQTYPVMPFLYPGKRLLVRGWIHPWPVDSWQKFQDNLMIEGWSFKQMMLGQLAIHTQESKLKFTLDISLYSSN